MRHRLLLHVELWGGGKASGCSRSHRAASRRVAGPSACRVAADAFAADVLPIVRRIGAAGATARRGGDGARWPHGSTKWDLLARADLPPSFGPIRVRIRGETRG